jgi:multidrug resistance efflux pump
MKAPNPRILVPLVIVPAFGLAGRYVERVRARERSTLSGFFESQPTQVAARVSGRIARLLVEEGAPVRAGQPLIELEANPAGEETASKQALAEQAQQQLRQVVTGPRAEDIRRQEEVVAEARAALSQLQNGPRPEEIEQARAGLRRAEAEYRKVCAGARPEEIAAARAAERAAFARLAQAQRGPTPQERAEARARLDAALEQERLARRDAARSQALFQNGFVARQKMETDWTALRAAEAKRREQEEAWRRADLGTPAEELEEARQAHDQAQAALDLALVGSRREEIDAAAAGVQAAEQALAMLLRGTRPEEISAAEARLAQAEAALSALRAGSRREEIAQARAAARAADALAKSSQRSLEERVVRAPQDGVVERIPVAVGDLVSAGTLLLRLANPEDLWVRVYLPESALAGVAVGSPASLRVDGIAEPVAAYVESVATQGEFTPANLQTPGERGKQVFGVRLRARRPDQRLKAGMYVTVENLGSWQAEGVEREAATHGVGDGLRRWASRIRL